MPRGDTCLTGPARAVLLPLWWEVLNEWGDKTCSIGPAHAVLCPVQWEVLNAPGRYDVFDWASLYSSIACTVGGTQCHGETRRVRLDQLMHQPSPFNKNVCANCRVLSDTYRH